MRLEKYSDYGREAIGLCDELVTCSFSLEESADRRDVFSESNVVDGKPENDPSERGRGIVLVEIVLKITAAIVAAAARYPNSALDLERQFFSQNGAIESPVALRMERMLCHKWNEAELLEMYFDQDLSLSFLFGLCQSGRV